MQNLEMPDFFTYLPPEIIIDILSRLPVRTIISCRRVCRSLLGLVDSPEFAELHLPRSVPNLAIYQRIGHRKPYKVYEFVEDLARRKYSPFCYIVFNFNYKFSHDAYIHSSVDGFLFMYTRSPRRPRDLLICNPVTRDYITLPYFTDNLFLDHILGFGVSKVTCQYKLVRIYRFTREFVPPECEVYTVGTGSWRSIEHASPIMYKGRKGAYLNGKLHWLATDSEGYQLISCFDLETELFTAFLAPPKSPDDYCPCISALGDCLCVCLNVADEFIIWTMKEYGDEKSWEKEFVIRKPIHDILRGKFCGFYFPLKVFKTGEILVGEEDGPILFCYLTKSRTIKEIDAFRVHSFIHTSTVIYTPSFLPARMFVTENVNTF